ncbi:hypothetical protein [Actinoplanes sp. CA-252034]|uniref:hypothetical protein n=1 Tax=Actinoplanes sp. CA-252034 TaxID=3239906 RepID=UPI003D98FEAC
MAIAFMLHDHSTPLGLLPRAGGDDLAAILLIGLGILGSIWLGRRGRPTAPWPRRLQRLGTGFLVLFAVIGFFEVDSAAQRDYYYNVGYTDPRPEPLSGVRDVFVYDGDGKLLVGVQLYDQDGQPIMLGEQTCYDEDGQEMPITNPGYPYCPARAPFQSGEPSLSTGPSTGPTAGATGQPRDASPSPSPSR